MYCPSLVDSAASHHFTSLLQYIPKRPFKIAHRKAVLGKKCSRSTAENTHRGREPAGPTTAHTHHQKPSFTNGTLCSSPILLRGEPEGQIKPKVILKYARSFWSSSPSDAELNSPLDCGVPFVTCFYQRKKAEPTGCDSIAYITEATAAPSLWRKPASVSWELSQESHLGRLSINSKPLAISHPSVPVQHQKHWLKWQDTELELPSQAASQVLSPNTTSTCRFKWWFSGVNASTENYC